MFTILHLSDPHFGAANHHQAEAILDIAATLQPDFTLVSGDFSMRARKREMRAAAHWYMELPVPRMAIPGNHDVPLLNHLYDRFFNSFGRYKRYIDPKLEPHAELPVGKLIGLNSSTPFGLHIDWSRGFLSPQQGHRMEKAFTSLPPELFRLVTFHHPLHRKGEGTRTLVHPLTLILRSLAIGGVDIVFAGHFHQAYAGIIDLHNDGRNVLVSQAATCCSTRLKGEPAGFHVVKLETGPKRAEIHRYAWHIDCFQLEHISRFEKNYQRWKNLDD